MLNRTLNLKAAEWGPGQGGSAQADDTRASMKTNFHRRLIAFAKIYTCKGLLRYSSLIACLAASNLEVAQPAIIDLPNAGKPLCGSTLSALLHRGASLLVKQVARPYVNGLLTRLVPSLP